MRKRWRRALRRSGWAGRASVIAVIALAALLLFFAATSGPLPPRLLLTELTWAQGRRWHFQVTIVLLALALGSSVLAGLLRRSYRPWLALGWIVFLAIWVMAYGARLGVMWRVLQWQYGLDSGG